MSHPTAQVLVLGAGASGLVCAAEAARRGRSVCVVDHQARPGRKLLATGGGRCNFTNRDVSPRNFLTSNPHFPISALARLSPAAFLERLERARIPWEEREQGRLFCRRSAADLLDLLIEDARGAGVTFQLSTRVEAVRPAVGGWEVPTPQGVLTAEAVVVATGGPAAPQLGATAVAWDIARALDVPATPPSPALVPFRWTGADRLRFADLAGNVATVAIRTGASPVFQDQLLFTHTGLSGPAALQASSWWRPGQDLVLDLLPDPAQDPRLRETRRSRPRLALRTALGWHLPPRLVALLAGTVFPDEALGTLSETGFQAVLDRLHALPVRPGGLAGWRNAEVSAGGVSPDALSSRTMEVRGRPGLHFVGEAVDVTGWLGGYNLHWAWASGAAAGQAA